MLARSLSQRVPGHLEQQFVDAVRRARSEDGFPPGAGRGGPRRLLFGTDSSFFPRGWNSRGLRGADARPGVILESIAADARDDIRGKSRTLFY